MVDIDGVGSRKGRAIIIHNINMWQALDPENGSNRIAGPICRGTTDPPILQDCSHRIEPSIGPPRLILLMGIGRCSYEAMPNALTWVGWAPVFVQGQGRGGSFHGQINLCRQEPINLSMNSGRGQPGRSPSRPGRFRFGKEPGLLARTLEKTTAGQCPKDNRGQNRIQEQNFHNERPEELIFNKAELAADHIF